MGNKLKETGINVGKGLLTCYSALAAGCRLRPYYLPAIGDELSNLKGNADGIMNITLIGDSVEMIT